MGRIIKALILGWIGKKIYDRVQGSDEAETGPAKNASSGARPKSAATAKKAAPKRTTRKTTRSAA